MGGRCVLLSSSPSHLLHILPPRSHFPPMRELAARLPAAAEQQHGDKDPGPVASVRIADRLKTSVDLFETARASAIADSLYNAHADNCSGRMSHAKLLLWKTVAHMSVDANDFSTSLASERTLSYETCPLNRAGSPWRGCGPRAR